MNVYRPNGKSPLSPDIIADWANLVSMMTGGLNNRPFTAACFTGGESRLNGFHCNCGTKDGTQNSPSLGEFELLPISDPCVMEGAKAYMFCRKCGAYSHL